MLKQQGLEAMPYQEGFLKSTLAVTIITKRSTRTYTSLLSLVSLCLGGESGETELTTKFS